MKKILSVSVGLVLLMSCGGANDGKATTDTTTMPMDTTVGKSSTNTMTNNTGTYTTDSSSRRSDSVSASDPKSRSTTPGNNADKQRQQHQ